ncbi:MAG TPA: NAD-dependent deacylase [Anaerolineae bacterium]|nr:NAD-dependent deacylase [Anaerolineae bacterium]
MTLPKIAVLTGAGVSKGSGVPTFRDGADSLWRNYNPQDLATPEAFARNPRLVWEFYDWRRQMMANARPNPAHLTLAAMEKALPDFTLVTQNIDGLHREAGNRRILYLHGDIWYVRCTECDYRSEDRRVPLPELPPTCPRCAAWLRPDVVWFGEALDPVTLHRAEQAFSQADIALVVGTSAVVYPAAMLPHYTRERGGRIIEFNMARTPLSPYADETILGPSEETLPAWWEAFQAELGL